MQTHSSARASPPKCPIRYPAGLKIAVTMPDLGHLLPFVSTGKARRPHLLPPSSAPQFLPLHTWLKVSSPKAQPVQGWRHSLLDYQMLVVTLGLHQCNLTSHQSDLPNIKPALTQYPTHLHREDEASVFTVHDSIPSLEELCFGISLAASSLFPYFIPKFKPYPLSLLPHFPFSIPLQAPFLTTQE